MWQIGVESGPHSSNRRILVCTAAVAVLLVCCGCWNPMMMHPTAYESGRMLPAGRVELAGQFWPGGAAAVGLGRGWQLDGFYGYVGDDVKGGQGRLSKNLMSPPPFYFAGSGACEYFENKSRGFKGFRLSSGLVMSWYSAGDVVGLHLPLKLYYMEYDWESGWDESRHISFHDEHGRGVILVPGFGFSVEQPHWALKLAFNVPSQQHIDHVEILPYFGAQVAIRF